MLLKSSHWIFTFTTSFLLLSLKWAVPTTYTLDPSSVSSSVTVLGKAGLFCLFFNFISRRILNASASAINVKKNRKQKHTWYKVQVCKTENKNVATKQQSRAKRPLIYHCNLTFNSEATSLRVPSLERLPPSMGLSPGFLPCGHWDRLSTQFSKGKREAVWQVRWTEKQRILRKGIH